MNLALIMEDRDPCSNDLDEQMTTELFWRYQLTKDLAITPAIQHIHNPALNPNTNKVTPTLTSNERRLAESKRDAAGSGTSINRLFS